MMIEAKVTINLVYNKASSVRQVKLILNDAIEEMVNRGSLTDDSEMTVETLDYEVEAEKY